MTSKQARTLYKKTRNVQAREAYRLWKLAEWKEKRDSEKELRQEVDMKEPKSQEEWEHSTEDEDDFIVYDDDDASVKQYVYVSSDDEDFISTRKQISRMVDWARDRSTEPATVRKPEIPIYSLARQESQPLFSSIQPFKHIDDLVEIFDMSHDPDSYDVNSYARQPSQKHRLPQLRQNPEECHCRKNPIQKSKMTALKTEKLDCIVVIDMLENAESNTTISSQTHAKANNLVARPQKHNSMQVIDLDEFEGHKEDVVRKVISSTQKPKNLSNNKRRIDEAAYENADKDYFKVMAPPGKMTKVQHYQSVSGDLGSTIVNSGVDLPCLPSNSRNEKEIVGCPEYPHQLRNLNSMGGEDAVIGVAETAINDNASSTRYDEGLTSNTDEDQVVQTRNSLSMPPLI
ncbi:hypothetical protein MMC18_002826 [Xylographa bjoerkii]|nr:hypothetical protein [Xylographa bjoerkii]